MYTLSEDGSLALECLSSSINVRIQAANLFECAGMFRQLLPQCSMNINAISVSCCGSMDPLNIQFMGCLNTKRVSVSPAQQDHDRLSVRSPA